MKAHTQAVHEGGRGRARYTKYGLPNVPEEYHVPIAKIELKNDSVEFIENKLKELDKEGFVDISEKKQRKDLWVHFLVNETIGVGICKYCLNRFKLVR